MSGRLFGRERPLHDILGGGNVADILLWRDKKISGAILVGLAVIWLLFEVVEYNFVTLLCHILIILKLILFAWTKGAALIKRDPPSVDDIKLSESTFRFIFVQLNSFLIKFYDISTGKDLKLFIGTAISLWMLSVVGSFVNSFSLLFIVFLGTATLPALYEKYEEEVDSFAGKSSQNLLSFFEDINAKFLDRIPRGPLKQN